MAVLTELGDLWLEYGDADEAETAAREWQQLCEIPVDAAPAAVMLARCHMHREEFEQAEEVLCDAQADLPEDPAEAGAEQRLVMLALVTLYAALGDGEEAEFWKLELESREPAAGN